MQEEILPLLWIQKMNNIRACVREVVEREIID